MAQKNIYIVRHGETEYNKTGYLQGSTINASLNETGRAQSEAFFEMYKNIPLDKIYTSDLKRSIESVELFMLKNVPVENCPELNEINWGIIEGKKISPKAWIRLRKTVHRWRKGELNVRIPGGDSPIDVAARQKVIIDKILSRDDEKNILISMHGRAMRIFICLLMGEPLTEMEKYNHDNMGLYLVSFKDGKMTMLKKNDKEHFKYL